MRPTTALRVLLATGAAVGAVALCSSAFAQGSTDPNDALRALVPRANPASRRHEGDAIYRRSRRRSQIDRRCRLRDGSALSGPCGGFCVSYDGDGKLSMPRPTSATTTLRSICSITSRPSEWQSVKVDTKGVVAYFGFAPQTGDGPRDHKWTIKTAGVSLDSGGDATRKARTAMPPRRSRRGTPPHLQLQNKGEWRYDLQKPLCPAPATAGSSSTVASRSQLCRGSSARVLGRRAHRPAVQRPPAMTWKE